MKVSAVCPFCVAWEEVLQILYHVKGECPVCGGTQKIEVILTGEGEKTVAVMAKLSSLKAIAICKEEMARQNVDKEKIDMYVSVLDHFCRVKFPNQLEIDIKE